MLETTECVLINNNGNTYTDCMEFSLLRFLQLLLYDSKEIHQQHSSPYPKLNQYHSIMKKHISMYPIIYKNASHYLENIDEREKWAILLSNLDLIYYRNDNCELYTNTKNIYLFLNLFLSMKLDSDEDDSKNLEIISKQFTNKKKKVCLSIKENTVQKKEMPMKEIIGLLSRPDNELLHHIHKKEYVTTISNTISILIDDQHYEWKLTQVTIDHSKYSNRFITGHSVIIKL